MTTGPASARHQSSPGWWISLRCAVLDRVAAGLLAVLLGPIVAVLAIAVKREDQGPAFVRVPRVGRDGTPFGMWKLRSMRADGADGRATGAPLTGTADPRITRVGARLRHYHLDEIPQLANVLRGEMLLLGSRPEAPEFVDPDDPDWQAVLSVPPGIAGPTQLIAGDWERHHIADDPEHRAYRSVVVPTKLALDRWYLESASPWLDLLTLVALGQRLGSHPGPSRMEQRARRALPEVAHRIDTVDHPSDDPAPLPFDARR